MLLQPARLPQVLGFRSGEAAVVVEHVRVPLAPLAGAPADRHRRHVDDEAGVALGDASRDPALGFHRNEGRHLGLEGQVTAAIPQQELEHLAAAQRAERLAHPRRAIGGAGAGEAERAAGVGQELRVVEVLRRAAELEHEGLGWKRHHELGGGVALEVVVVVLQEEDRQRAQHGAVEVGDLRPDRALQHALVLAAEHRLVGGELAGALDGAGHAADPLAAPGGGLVPVDVVPVRDHRARLERERAAQQPLARREGEERRRRRSFREPLVAAGAGVDQQPHPLHLGIGTRERAQRPRIEQRGAAPAAASSFVERELVLGVGRRDLARRSARTSRRCRRARRRSIAVRCGARGARARGSRSDALISSRSWLAVART